ncbi:MAG: PHP domain-containing protein [Kosmotoga sp.]|nr:MAG: PHP domain-containing protein [Kosmotoga sp.]
MKKFRADLHIHSVLSPCGSLEMSPANIVREAKNKKLDIIAITDHNSTKNSKALLDLLDNDITFFYGMELQTVSETHILALFDTYDYASEFNSYIYGKLPDIRNKPEYFGDQVVVDKDENILEMEKKLLAQSVNIDIEEAVKKIHRLKGLAIPSHINRDMYGIISQLGFLPENIDFDALEIDERSKFEEVKTQYKNKYPIIKNSDAHYLEDIGTYYTKFYIEAPTVSEIKKARKGIEGRKICYDA